MVKKAPPPLQENFVRQYQELEEWEQHMIIASLQKVAAMMDAENIDAAPVVDVGFIDRQVELQVKPGAGGKTH